MTRVRIIAAVTLASAAGLSSLAFAAAPATRGVALMPGVHYETLVRRTTHGPLVVHVVTAPRPGGLYSLTPVLSNDSVVGRETVSSMQRRLARSATMVGVNGDLFAWKSGRPSGILVRDGELVHPPAGARSSIDVTTDGVLGVSRLAFSGTWQGVGQARPLDDLNQAPARGRSSLFTAAWGPTAPALPNAFAVTLFPFPLATPNVPLAAPIVDVRRTSAPVAIPAGGAVILARGASAAPLEAEAPIGSTLTVTLGVGSLPGNTVSAIGGGPLIVRDGKPVFRANEGFEQRQLAPRNPRTAVGQLADGRILLVVVDGRSPGYSVGVTNWELARLVRSLGAVTASAVDAGGSSTLAFDGAVLNRPSDRSGERPVSEGLMVAYTGVFARAVEHEPVPRRFGQEDPLPSFTYKVVRDSTVTVSLAGPNGEVTSEQVARTPGVYTVPLAPTAANGRWTLTVDATDDLEQASHMSASAVVNRVLADATAAPSLLRVPPGGGAVTFGWRQKQPAWVRVSVERRNGTPVRRLVDARLGAGPASAVWDGLDARGKLVRGGVYVVRLSATTGLGTQAVLRRIAVRRVAAP